MLSLKETIRPSADLRNHYNEISKQCREDKEAVIITVNGRGDTVSLSYEEYKNMKSRIELLEILADAEDEAQLDPESEAFVEDKFLINKSVLTPFKSILILILRKYYQERFSQGESSIVIDIDYIKNALLPYMNISVSDRKDQQKLNGALRDLCEYHLLKRLPSEDNDRFLILPLIRFVVDLNKLNELLEEFRKVNGTVVGSEDADNE